MPPSSREPKIKRTRQVETVRSAVEDGLGTLDRRRRLREQQVTSWHVESLPSPDTAHPDATGQPVCAFSPSRTVT